MPDILNVNYSSYLSPLASFYASPCKRFYKKENTI